MLRAVLLVAISTASVVPAEEPSSAPSERIGRIERLLDEVRVELDSLRNAVRAEEARAAASMADAPVSHRQRLLDRATRTEYHAVSAGYSFSPALPFALNVQAWKGRWGGRLEGGVLATDETRLAGAAATGLFRISRYDALDIMETSLYGLAGVGTGWERVQWSSHLDEPWYETPDRFVFARLGVGTELRFYGLGGVRFAPETGFQARSYGSRYQHSASYAIAHSPDDVPESDFELGPFFAFHVNFYFR